MCARRTIIILKGYKYIKPVPTIPLNRRHPHFFSRPYLFFSTSFRHVGVQPFGVAQTQPWCPKKSRLYSSSRALCCCLVHPRTRHHVLQPPSEHLEINSTHRGNDLFFHDGFTADSRRCYVGLTGVRGCTNGFTTILRFYDGVVSFFVTMVSRRFHEGFTTVSWRYCGDHNGFIANSWRFHGVFTTASRRLHDDFMTVSRRLQDRCTAQAVRVVTLLSYRHGTQTVHAQDLRTLDKTYRWAKFE